MSTIHRTGLAAGIALTAAAAAQTATAPVRGTPTTMSHKLSSADCFATNCTQWYTLFNQPSAQCREGKTFIVYPGSNLDPLVVCYDHAVRRWSGPVRAGKNPLINDDHGNPAMLIDAAGLIHVFYGCMPGP